MKIFAIFLSALLVNNFVMSRFLGICSFLGVSKKVETATGMGLAVTFVMGLASFISYIVFQFILVPLKVTYLYTLAFVLVIAALVQFVEMVIKKTNPGLYKALGVYLPLITTNCAELGVALINVEENYDILTGIINGVGTAAGYTIAIIILAGIREQMEYNDVPKSFQGSPIVLITATLMAMAFSGFAGLL
jgi:electron transport complex protein RnfA